LGDGSQAQARSAQRLVFNLLNGPRWKRAPGVWTFKEPKAWFHIDQALG